jgi:3-hydroxyisobutyrate dehydrogenase-like beta-hydroxyacid dehydrogenase
MPSADRGSWLRPCWATPTSPARSVCSACGGGAPQAVARARPVLERLGQRVFVVGNDPGHASLVKVAGNVLTARDTAKHG